MGLELVVEGSRSQKIDPGPGEWDLRQTICIPLSLSLLICEMNKEGMQEGSVGKGIATRHEDRVSSPDETSSGRLSSGLRTRAVECSHITSA